MGEAGTPFLENARRWFHRRERSLIVLWLLLLLGLNLLPVAWLLANHAWGIDDKLVRGYRWYCRRRYLSAMAAVQQDPTAGLRRLQALVADMGPVQLRETRGRLRQDALVEMARLQLTTGDPKGAVRTALEVTRADPYDTRGWVAMGDALWERNTKDEAVHAYERALEMNPNLEHPVHRVMEHRAETQDWKGVVAAFERYRDAVWSLPLELDFTDSWPHFDPKHRIVIPVLADGSSHQWRVHPAHPRAVGSFAFRKMRSIDGLRIHLAAPGVVLRIGRLVVEGPPTANTDRPDILPPHTLIFPHGPLCGWKPGGALVRLGERRWLIRGTLTFEGPAPIPNPGEVTRITLEMTLSKTVQADTVRLLRWACHNLGHDHKIEGLLRPLAVVPEPGPGPNPTARPAGAGTGATVHFPDRAGEAGSSRSDVKGHKGYSIAIAGHVRRGPRDDPPLLPALVAAVPEISLRDRALVLTGDVVWEGTPVRWKRLDEFLRRPLGIPLFIAPGNHDLFDGRAGAARERFVTLFGPTGRTERIGSSLLLVLDTEESPGDISTGQLEMALAAMDEAGRDPEISSVLVFLHRVLWFLGDSRYAHVAKRANRSSVPGEPGNGDGHNFCSTLLPRLRELARTRAVAVVAGDVGTRLPLVFDRRGGVVLIASGNRAQDPPAWWNHYLRLHVEHGDLRFEAVPLGPASLGPVERYTPEFWKTHPAPLRSPLEVHP